MKTVVKIVLGVVAVLLLGAGGLFGWASMKDKALLARTIETHSVDFPIPFPLTEAEVAEVTMSSADGNVKGDAPAEVDLDAMALEQAVERGRHLTQARYACRECHGQNFGGGIMVDDPMIGTLHGPNITAGAGGRTANFTAADWDRIVRHGVLSTGQPAVMPSEEFRNMSDQELSDIVAFIRSLPPVDNEEPARKLGPLGTMLVAFNQIPLAADLITDHQAAHPALPPEAEASAEFGAHLAGTCGGCHSANFAGGPIPGGDPSWPPAANLTPAGNMANWTVDEFATLLRTGKRPDGTEVKAPMNVLMSFGQNMTDTEIEALYHYFRSLPATPTP